MPRPRNDILQGTLALLVLQTLSSRGRMHGYAITQHIQRASADLLRVEEGSLYPALYRLERRGWIDAEWGLSENNRKVKYYRLTAAGRERLGVELAQWRRFATAVGKILYQP